MAKVKKTVSDEQKIKKGSNILSTRIKDKTSKNKQKNLGAISPKFQKPLKELNDMNNRDSIKTPGKKKVNSSNKQHTNKVKLPQNSKSKEASVGLKNTAIGKSKQKQSPQIQNGKDKSPKSKTIGSKIQNKFTTKIKKTAIFKHKAPKFKVKTDLILNQKSKKSENITGVNLEENSVRSGIKALFNVIQSHENSKTLFKDEVPIFVQFSAIKIGKTPSRTLRIPLKHSLLKESSEICLIIEDAKEYSKKEFEKTIERYENLLRENNITNIKTIMTFYQLKTEYSEFELKRKLVELYDLFIVDAKLSGYVSKKLGKIFRDKRKMPIPLRLDGKNLKENIDFAMRKTSTNLHPHGDNFTIQIAHSDMSEEQIYENFEEVCKGLAHEFPGGWSNIRGLHLKTPKSLGIPVYYSLKNASELSVPIAKAKRPKAYKEVTGELSTKDDMEVRVLPTGTVTLKKRKKSKQKSKENMKTKKTKKNKK